MFGMRQIKSHFYLETNSYLTTVLFQSMILWPFLSEILSIGNLSHANIKIGEFK